MLKVLIEKDDFYSKESNPHLGYLPINSHNATSSVMVFFRPSLTGILRLQGGTTGKNLHFSSWILIVPADFLEQIRVTQGLVPSLLLLVTISTSKDFTHLFLLCSHLNNAYLHSLRLLEPSLTYLVLYINRYAYAIMMIRYLMH